MSKLVGEYELGRTLGRGTYATVKLAVHRPTGKQYAIKIIKRENMTERAAERLRTEIAIMRCINHPHIIRLSEVMMSDTRFFLVMQYCPKGEFLQLLNHIYSEDEAAVYFCQLCCALHYCHRFGICHRDLKFENVLLDEQNHLIVTDFGLGAVSNSPDKTFYSQKTTCGSAHYIAPEVISEKKYDGRKADIWSLGVMLYSMVHGALPFPEDDIQKLFDKIQRCSYVLDSSLSPELQDLLRNLLQPDPQKRLSFREIFKHPFLKGRIEFVPDPDDSVPAEYISEYGGNYIRILPNSFLAEPLRVKFAPGESNLSDLRELHKTLNIAEEKSRRIAKESSPNRCPFCDEVVTLPSSGQVAGFSQKCAVLLTGLNLEQAYLSVCAAITAAEQRIGATRDLGLADVKLCVLAHKGKISVPLAGGESRLLEARISGGVSGKYLLGIGCQDKEFMEAVSAGAQELSKDSARLASMNIRLIPGLSGYCESVEGGK